MQTERISKKVWDSLPEYSCSNPSAVFPGKVWKSKIDYHDESKGWVICEYVQSSPGHCKIDIRIPKIV